MTGTLSCGTSSLILTCKTFHTFPTSRLWCLTTLACKGVRVLHARTSSNTRVSSAVCRKAWIPSPFYVAQLRGLFLKFRRSPVPVRRSAKAHLLLSWAFIYIYIYFFYYHSKTSLLDVNCQRVKSEQGNLRGETRNGSLPEGKVGRVRVSKCNVFRSNKCIRWWISESRDSS